MAIFPGPDKSCFYLDPAAGLTDGGLWRDSSKYGLHVTPVGYAAPAYGIATGPSGAKMITFNGANQYGEFPAAASARFHALYPFSSVTVAAVVKYTSHAGSNRLFADYSAGPGRGMQYDHWSAGRMELTGVDSAAAVSGLLEGASGPLIPRVRVLVGATVTGTSVLRYAWRDGIQGTTAANGAGVGPWVASVNNPRVGCASHAVAELLDGDLYFLGIWLNVIWTHSEAVAFSDYWRDRT
jgi:hypothetical protein